MNTHHRFIHNFKTVEAALTVGGGTVEIYVDASDFNGIHVPPNLEVEVFRTARFIVRGEEESEA